MCLSPAGKEVPQIPEGQGELGYPVSKQAKNEILHAANDGEKLEISIFQTTLHF